MGPPVRYHLDTALPITTPSKATCPHGVAADLIVPQRRSICLVKEMTMKDDGGLGRIGNMLKNTSGCRAAAQAGRSDAAVLDWDYDPMIADFDAH